MQINTHIKLMFVKNNMLLGARWEVDLPKDLLILFLLYHTGYGHMVKYCNRA